MSQTKTNAWWRADKHAHKEQYPRQKKRLMLDLAFNLLGSVTQPSLWSWVIELATNIHMKSCLHVPFDPAIPFFCRSLYLTVFWIKEQSRCNCTSGLLHSVFINICIQSIRAFLLSHSFSNEFLSILLECMFFLSMCQPHNFYCMAYTMADPIPCDNMETSGFSCSTDSALTL